MQQGAWGSSALGGRLMDRIWRDDPFCLPERQDIEPVLPIPNGNASEPIAAAVSVSAHIGWPISRSVSDHPAGYDARVRSGFLARGLRAIYLRTVTGMRRLILPDPAAGGGRYRPAP